MTRKVDPVCGCRTGLNSCTLEQDICLVLIVVIKCTGQSVFQQREVQTEIILSSLFPFQIRVTGVNLGSTVIRSKCELVDGSTCREILASGNSPGCTKGKTV